MLLKMGTITANFIKPRALINLLLQISSERGPGDYPRRGQHPAAACPSPAPLPLTCRSNASRALWGSQVTRGQRLGLPRTCMCGEPRSLPPRALIQSSVVQALLGEAWCCAQPPAASPSPLLENALLDCPGNGTRSLHITAW